MYVVRREFVSNSRFLCQVEWFGNTSRKLRLIMNTPLVTVKQGKLQGVVLKSVLGPSYNAFKGIPFAAPPVGNLRFKDPQPPMSWEGVRDASKNGGVISAQLGEYPPFEFVGGEDCLYLNVYTTCLTERKPVMFWIHGGAFVVGNGNDIATQPDYLVTKDVVLVSINYRLGALGFLNLGDKNASGNQGLKDLIMGLKWVKENIAQFGGDPNNVTIFGLSAGGALVHALTLSPSAKGLFQKAIMQSGVLNSPWGVEQSRPERAFKLASLLGKDSTDPQEVFEFLQTIPPKQIVEVQNNILTPEQRHAYELTFGVMCDKHAENPVLPLPLPELASNDADVSIMVGYTSHESIMFQKDTSDEALPKFLIHLPDHVENLATLRQSAGDVNIDQLTKRVTDQYFTGKLTRKDQLLSLIRFVTDVYFIIPANRLVYNRVQRKTAPTYLYQFSYVGNEKTVTDLLVEERAAIGASHADELSYLFYVPRCKVDNPEVPAIGTKDRTTIERLTRMWSNFAKTGNPTPCLDQYVNTTWTPTTKDNYKYMDISDDLKMLSVQPDILIS